MYKWLLLFLLPLSAWSQSFNLTGDINLPSGAPAAKAGIILFSFNDSSNKEILADTFGKFQLKNLKKGNYLLTIRSAGMKKHQENINLDQDIDLNISLITDNKKIEEVNVTAKQSIVKISGDKKIYNVSQDITAIGGSASDVMKNIPGVTVSPVDGEVAIRGNSNITLLIDGKQSVIFGDDVATALQNIPAASIENIEVINNAGAAYDAQGKGGIINIILKKDRKAGLNGNVNMNISYPYRANAGIGLNVNNKKWNYFFNANARSQYTYTREHIQRVNANDTSTYTKSMNARNPQSGFMNLGVEYNPSKRDKITLTQSFFGAEMFGTINSSLESKYSQDLVSRLVRLNTYTGRPRNGTTSLGYIHNFRKAGQEIKADLSVGLSQYRRESELITDLFNADNIIFLDNIIQQIPVRGHNENITASTDFKTPIDEKNKLDIGAKMIDFQFVSQNFPTIQYPGQPEPVFEEILKNHFEFTQKTYAFYSNLNHKFNEKWNAQIGLRAERFDYRGFVYQYIKGVSGSFLNLFPSSYITYKHKENQDFTFNYTRRTNRPNFFNLIPFIDVSNPQDTSMGNPELRPEFINAFELGYNTLLKGKHNFFLSAYYQYNQNLISRYRRFNPNGTTFTQTRNLTSGTTYGVEGNLKYIFSKKLDATFNANVFYNYINTSNIDANLISNGMSGFGKVIMNYKLNPYDLQVTGNYNGPSPIVQGYMKSYGNIDVALKRNFLKKKLIVTLTGNDIFNMTKQVSIYELADVYYQKVYRKPLSRQVGLAVQYRFLSKNMNPADVKERKLNGKGKDEKEVNSRDENLKNDDEDEDSNSGGNNSGPK